MAVRVPKLCHHKASGRAYATLDGKQVFFGRWGDPEARERYDRAIASWLAAGRKKAEPPPPGLPLEEALLRYLDYAAGYYANSPPELEHDRLLVRRLLRLFPDLPAKDFSPLKLKTFRESLVRRNLTRSMVNRTVSRVRRIFAWLAAEELIPAEVAMALRLVAGLRRGKSEAKEGQPRLPVLEADYQAVLPHLLPQTRAMVELLYITGMRPGEVCRMTMADLDRSESPWVYTLKEHKTVAAVGTRKIFLGPAAQNLLAPFLRLDKGPLFQPKDAVAARHQRDRATRKTPVQPSQVDRSKEDPRRTPGDFYRAGELCKAVKRACKRVGVAEWCPSQLRHNAADRLARAHNAEVARLVLGHTKLTTTAIYLSRDEEMARQVAEEMG